MGAVIKDHERKVKLEIADFPLFPRLAILDPESTRTLPPQHRRRHRDGRDDPRDRGLRLAGLEPAPGRPLARGAAADPRQPRARGRADPSDEDARGNMLVAASLAITISLGSTHAMSHPCGAHFGVPHGVANAINLPHVIRFNAAGGEDIADRYRDIAEIFGVEAGGSGAEVGDALAAHVAGHGRADRAAHAAVPGGGPEEGIPILVEGGGRRADAAEPARADRGGLRGALRKGAVTRTAAALVAAARGAGGRRPGRGG